MRFESARYQGIAQVKSIWIVQAWSYSESGRSQEQDTALQS